MAKTDTHNKLLYRLLVNGGTITNLEALTKYRIGRLASRVSDLINLYNVPIHKEWEPNSDGEGRHTRYSIRQEDRIRLKDIPLEEVYRTYK